MLLTEPHPFVLGLQLVLLSQMSCSSSRAAEFEGPSLLLFSVVFVRGRTSGGADGVKDQKKSLRVIAYSWNEVGLSLPLRGKDYTGPPTSLQGTFSVCEFASLT